MWALLFLIESLKLQGITGCCAMFYVVINCNGQMRYRIIKVISFCHGNTRLLKIKIGFKSLFELLELFVSPNHKNQ